ncbi:MAG: AAA family ATPase [Cellulomonas sp.]
MLLDAAETDGLPHRPIESLGQLPLRTEQNLGALAPDQRVAAEAVITSGHLLDVLVGPAGSGKTTTLAALTSFWRQNVGPVVGLAPSATAAHTLSTSLGVTCETARYQHVVPELVEEANRRMSELLWGPGGAALGTDA